MRAPGIQGKIGRILGIGKLVTVGTQEGSLAVNDHIHALGIQVEEHTGEVVASIKALEVFTHRIQVVIHLGKVQCASQECLHSVWHHVGHLHSVQGHLRHHGIAVISGECHLQQLDTVFIRRIGWEQHEVRRMNHNSHPLVLIQQLGRIIECIFQGLQRIVGPGNIAYLQGACYSRCEQDIVHTPVFDRDQQFPCLGMLNFDFFFTFHYPAKLHISLQSPQNFPNSLASKSQIGYLCTVWTR